MRISVPGICDPAAEPSATVIYPRREHAGFTLVEILVALVVLGVFSLLAFQGLSRIVEGSGALKTSLGRVEDTGRAWAWLDQTCSRALLLRLPPLAPETQHADEADPPGFIAELWRPVAEAGAPPQRVLLALQDHRLSALIASVGHRTDTTAVTLLEGVEKFSLQALDDRLQPMTDWTNRANADRAALPAAMVLSLTLSDGRSFRRVFAPR